MTKTAHRSIPPVDFISLSVLITASIIGIVPPIVG